MDTAIAVVSSMQHVSFLCGSTPPTGTCVSGAVGLAQVMRQRGVEPTIATGSTGRRCF